MSRRITSWVANESDRDDRIRHAGRLIGQDVAAVHYFDLDYRANTDGTRGARPRIVTDPKEWTSPTWRYEAGDSLAYGLEIETMDRRIFSIIWDPPGPIEGIGVRETPMIGGALWPDASAAIWDVSTSDPWRNHLGSVISDVTMHYAPWDESGAWWCNRITMKLGASVVEMLLAEVEYETEKIAPSADNVLVLFDSPELPHWINGVSERT